MSDSTPTIVEFMMNGEAVNGLSIQVLNLLADNNMQVGNAAAVCALALSRVLTQHGDDDEAPSPEREVEFIQHILQTAGLFYMEGDPN